MLFLFLRSFESRNTLNVRQKVFSDAIVERCFRTCSKITESLERPFMTRREAHGYFCQNFRGWYKSHFARCVLIHNFNRISTFFNQPYLSLSTIGGSVEVWILPPLLSLQAKPHCLGDNYETTLHCLHQRRLIVHQIGFMAFGSF